MSTCSPLPFRLLLSNHRGAHAYRHETPSKSAKVEPRSPEVCRRRRTRLRDASYHKTNEQAATDLLCFDPCRSPEPAITADRKAYCASTKNTENLSASKTHHVANSWSGCGKNQMLTADVDNILYLKHSLLNSNKRLITEPLPENLPSWKRRLLMNCRFISNIPYSSQADKKKDSETIAVEMLAIDGRYNGWRYMVLPMALADELVMNAVLAVSAFHQFPHKFHEPERSTVDDSPSPQNLYASTIQGLQKRRNLQGSSDQDKQSVLITILVLLTGTLVTGGNEYPMILGMLRSATDALGGEEVLSTSELGRFFIRQVRK